MNSKAESLQKTLAETYPDLSVSMWRPDPKGDILFTFMNDKSNALCILLKPDMSLKEATYLTNRYSTDRGVPVTRDMLPAELKAVYDGVFTKKEREVRAETPYRSAERTEPVKNYGAYDGKEYSYER